MPFIFHWDGGKKKEKKAHIRLQVLAIENLIQEYPQPNSLACTRTEFQSDLQFGNLSFYRNTVLHCAVNHGYNHAKFQRSRYNSIWLKNRSDHRFVYLSFTVEKQQERGDFEL